ncbi:MAG TPA: 50S ribosomal protein L4 [Synergistales bacterium]|jgi:large subunit ribosomal protein L4|nr:50S ribosomal protein L4 [Synergistales bacterium]HRV70983.1 50S ribosomal protein L4 [Thermovirgaceae bacterium]
MPTVKVMNFQGEVIGEENLSEAVFAAPVHVPAMHQVVVAQQANARQGTHSTKTRADVRGGGKKPWKQKHTGRARHGSRRSPIWVGGGITHGPHPRDYHQKVNRKVRRLAIRSALSLKAGEGSLILLDRIDMEKPSTKMMVSFLNVAEASKKPLVMVSESNVAVSRSAGNIPGLMLLHVDSINVYDILNHRHLILTLDAARKIEEVYGA